jgi:hypothetical protein
MQHRIKVDDDLVLDTNEIAAMFPSSHSNRYGICFCLKGGLQVWSDSHKAFEVFRVWVQGGPYITRNVDPIMNVNSKEGSQ